MICIIRGFRNTGVSQDLTGRQGLRFSVKGVRIVAKGILRIRGL